MAPEQKKDLEEWVIEVDRDVYDEMRLHIKDLITSLRRNENEINELISNISHDLKTPLTTIKGYSEGLIDGVAATDDKKERYIKTIYSKANEIYAEKTKLEEKLEGLYEEWEELSEAVAELG